VDQFHEETGAIEMHVDAMLAGEAGNALHVVVAKHGVVLTSHWRLD
jgi:hypothetical protein